MVACSTSAHLWVCPPAQLCCPKFVPNLVSLNITVPEWFIRQCWDCFSTHHSENLYSLARSPSVSGIPDSRWVNPFLQLGILALHSRSLIRHKLPHGAATIRPSPSTARFQRPDYAVKSTDHLTSFLLEVIPQNSLPVHALLPIAFGLFGFWQHPEKLSMAGSLPVWCTHLM